MPHAVVEHEPTSLALLTVPGFSVAGTLRRNGLQQVRRNGTRNLAEVQRRRLGRHGNAG